MLAEEAKKRKLLGRCGMKGTENIDVCICTYRRPRELERLLESLDKLHFVKSDEPQIGIVVVENDVDEQARAVCEKFESLSRWPLRYAIEAEPGISRARNRCLSLVADDTDFIVFIDDDETVTENWLEDLLAVRRDYSADVVSGPVLPRYNDSHPEWIRLGGFHGRSRYATGAPISSCGAGNVLVACSFIKKHGLDFDPSFDFAGGEDILFFRTAGRLGAKMVWCDEAIAYETIPRKRATVTWLLQRSFRIGTTDAKTRRLMDGQLKSLAESVWLGATRIGFGGISLPIAIFCGRASVVHALSKAAFGLGTLLGGLGYTYKPYKRDPKSQSVTERRESDRSQPNYRPGSGY